MYFDLFIFFSHMLILFITVIRCDMRLCFYFSYNNSRSPSLSGITAMIGTLTCLLPLFSSHILHILLLVYLQYISFTLQNIHDLFITFCVHSCFYNVRAVCVCNITGFVLRLSFTAVYVFYLENFLI